MTDDAADDIGKIETRGWHCASHIRYVQIGETTVLLDLRNGTYVSFNGSASIIWSGIMAGQGIAGIADRLRAGIPDSDARLVQDVKAFLEQCRMRGYLSPSGEQQIGRATIQAKPRGTTIVNAWISIFQTSFSLWRCGFSATYQRAMDTSPTGVNDAVKLGRALHAFLGAENFFLFRKAPRDCLPRSLALFSFLTSAGLNAKHVIGIKLYPFQAHAWVEIDALPMLDSAARTELFHKIAVTR